MFLLSIIQTAYNINLKYRDEVKYVEKCPVKLVRRRNSHAFLTSRNIDGLIFREDGT